MNNTAAVMNRTAIDNRAVPDNGKMVWNFLQCAVQGRGHEKNGMPCQDKTCVLEKDGAWAAALADGAGSAALSHEGAVAVTRFICGQFCACFDTWYETADGIAVKRALLSGIDGVLSEKAGELSCGRRDLASTLLAVAVKDGHFMMLHIGDGVIGYLKADALCVASHPVNGEFTNTTVFTTSQEALGTMKLFKGNLKNIWGFILMSDGSEAGFYNKRTGTLQNVLRRIACLSVLTDGEQVQAQLSRSFDTVVRGATTDDCSIVIMAGRPRGADAWFLLSERRKRELVRISPRMRSTDAKRRLARYDCIIRYLETGRTLKQIAKQIHLKPEITKRKYLRTLCDLGLVEKRGSRYFRKMKE